MEKINEEQLMNDLNEIYVKLPTSEDKSKLLKLIDNISIIL